MTASIEDRLNASFKPQYLSIQDDSEKHRGHRQAQEGGGHYSVILVSDSFQGQPVLERHRKVYEVLKEEGIHALALKTYTIEEWKLKQNL